MTFVSVQVECSDKDLHSGVYGGSVHEAMTDLISLMGELRVSALWISTLSLKEVGRVLFLNYLHVPTVFQHPSWTYSAVFLINLPSSRHCFI